MISYNSDWLNNLLIRQQATEAFHEQCLSNEELNKINERFPDGFYTPNLFIRIGLFLLTVIILLFSFGLLILLFSSSPDKTIGGMSVFFALITYGALEYIVKAKNHLKSGVDDALLWVSAISLGGGISYLTSAEELANCWIIFIIAAFYSIRFADRIIVVAGFLALLGIFFFTITQWGIVAIAITPFLLMGVSLLTYIVTTRAQHRGKNLLYQNCLQILSIVSLLSIYFSGNYLAVREMGNAFIEFGKNTNQLLPFGWLFWILTCVIPLVYIARGIQKKDIMMIRVGLLLVAAIIFTVRYYYPLGSIEMIMAIAGASLVAISYGLSKYLIIPKYGFTYKKTDNINNDKAQLEAIIVAQTFSAAAVPSEGSGFGGGSFGGGG
ncbi:MAG: hypothetical protein ABIN94_07255, partial [Ferruginibacter sp.]